MIRRLLSRSAPDRTIPVLAAFALVLLSGPAAPEAAMLTAPLSTLVPEGSAPPPAVTIPMPEAEQGQVLIRHRSSRIVLDDETVERVLGALEPGTPVRLGLPGGDRALQGSYFDLDRDVVHVETAGGPVSLDRAGIRRVWVGRRQTGKGALFGAVHGFAFGMLMGARFSSDFETDRSYAGGVSRASQRSNLEEIGQLTFHWGLPVALIGAAVGAVIGSGVTGWQPVTP